MTPDILSHPKLLKYVFAAPVESWSSKRFADWDAVPFIISPTAEFEDNNIWVLALGPITNLLVPETENWARLPVYVEKLSMLADNRFVASQPLEELYPVILITRLPYPPK